MADAKTVLEFARKTDAKILDLRSTDIPGLRHHVSFPIDQLTEASFEEGFGTGSLEDALDALQRDHAFLLKGDVFTEELLRTYVEYKRSKEVDAIRLRPHPYEFALYYDI